jgi:hypothetical protein
VVQRRSQITTCLGRYGVPGYYLTTTRSTDLFPGTGTTAPDLTATQTDDSASKLIFEKTWQAAGPGDTLSYRSQPWFLLSQALQLAVLF